MMQLDDSFLNRSRGDQPIHGHRAGLPDAVSSVRRLLFGSWVPPGIEVNDVISTGQIQSEPTRLEADEKQFALAVLKGFYAGTALLLRRRTVEILIADAA